MQTFLPYSDFKETARCLDYRRLGKQRVEAWQTYRAIIYKNGWSHHPTVKMWHNNIGALLEYGATMCIEWKRRGYVDNMLVRFQKEMSKCYDFSKPKWIGDDEFHKSHKSNLLRKLPEHYSKFNWQVSSNLPYKWMVNLIA